MKLASSQLGEFELPEEAVFDFRHGLLGFEELHRFGLFYREEYQPFQWLVSVDEPNICFPMLSPLLLRPDYLVPLGNVERKALEAEPNDPLLPLVIVTIGSEQPGVSANLRGPILLNPKTRKGMQVVLFESGYPVRAEILLSSQAPAVP